MLLPSVLSFFSSHPTPKDLIWLILGRHTAMAILQPEFYEFCNSFLPFFVCEYRAGMHLSGVPNKADALQPLAPLRPAAKSASLALRGKSLTVHDLVVVTTFLRGGGEGPGPSSGPNPNPWP